LLDHVIGAVGIIACVFLLGMWLLVRLTDS